MPQIKLSQDDAKFLRYPTPTPTMTAYRNYELARLLKILKTMEIK